MKKDIFFLKGISALALVFTLVLAGCGGNDLQEVTGKVSLPKIDNPKVTEKVVTSGILLSWPPVLEAGGYEVWRNGGGQTAAINLTASKQAAQNQDGIFEFFDLVNLTNTLKSNTQYTYTVISVPLSPVKDIGKWEKKVTTGAIPAKGSAATAPVDVKLELDFGVKSVTIIVTPPAAGNIPSKYEIKFGSDVPGSGTISKKDVSPDSLTLSITGDKDAAAGDDAKIVYDLLKITSPKVEFYVKVNATLGDDDYFVPADTFETTKEYEPLFGDSSSLSASIGTLSTISNAIYGAGSSSDTVIGYYASINLSDIKTQPGVTYTLEKTTLDAKDKPGEYEPVTLSKDHDRNTPVDDLTVDIFGNFSILYTTVYDRQLSTNENKYQYRIKGVKDGVTDYIASNDAKVTVNFKDYLISHVALKVGSQTPGTGDNVKFEITPHYTGEKGVLQSADRVVLYWLIGNDETCYKTGPYTTVNSMSFSKTNLELALTDPPKRDLIVSENSGSDKYLYVQAYLERENGDKLPLNESRHWVNAGGLEDDLINHNDQYHYKLDY